MGHYKSTYLCYGLHLTDHTPFEWDLSLDEKLEEKLTSGNYEVFQTSDCNGETFIGKLIESLADDQKFSTEISLENLDDWANFFIRFCPFIGIANVKKEHLKLQIIQCWG